MKKVVDEVRRGFNPGAKKTPDDLTDKPFSCKFKPGEVHLRNGCYINIDGRVESDFQLIVFLCKQVRDIMVILTTARITQKQEQTK